MEEVETSEHLYRHPEHYYRSYSHAYVGAPRRQAQLLLEYEYAAKQTACCYDAGDGMAVAKEVAVVAEHEQQIACPEYHVQLHECHDAGVMGHGACGYLILARTEQSALPPIDEVASVLGREYVECHHHHPHAEGGRQSSRLQKTMWSQIAPRPENIPPKGVSFSDLICIFAMSIVEFSCLFCNTKISEFFDMAMTIRSLSKHYNYELSSYIRIH